MPHRTPSFLVVGLVLTMFLLGYFYMSCSSTTKELRQSLDEFEDRVRALTMKNIDHERELETVNTNKRELIEEKINIQKQIEKQNSEINALTTKLNEKLAEIQTLQSDKQVLEQQLRDSKNLTDTLNLKSLAAEKIQQEHSDQKNLSEKELTELKQQIENYKNQLKQSETSNQEKAAIIHAQHNQLLILANKTNQSSLLSSQQSLDIAHNITEKISNGNDTQTNNTLQLNSDAAGSGQNNSDAQKRVDRSVDEVLVQNKTSNDTDLANAQKTVTPSILYLNVTTTISNQNNKDEANANQKKTEFNPFAPPAN